MSKEDERNKIDEQFLMKLLTVLQRVDEKLEKSNDKNLNNYWAIASAQAHVKVVLDMIDKYQSGKNWDVII